MANDLTTLGEVIIDCTLVLNMIRGLKERFSHVAALIDHARPFPSFLEARGDLILEELTLENRKDAPSTALVVSTSSSPNHAPPLSNSHCIKRGGGGKGRSGSGSAGGQAPRPHAGA